ncbi:MAG: isochorismatase family protein [Actinomycetota bacterium]|nr:isochorismatase family protein [Actinomycetota bacterium]
MRGGDRDVDTVSGSGRCGFGHGPALLVVDMTRLLADPSHPEHLPAGARVAAACAPVVKAFRRADLPVFFSRGGKRWHTSTANALTLAERGAWLRKGGWRNDAPADGQAAMTITPQLAPLPDEVVVTKSKPSAFFATPLPSYLLAARVDTLVVAGMMTSGCVRATVTDAFSYDLRVVVPEQCVGDKDQAAHKANLVDIDRKYGDVVGVDEVLATIAAGHLPTPTAAAEMRGG